MITALLLLGTCGFQNYSHLGFVKAVNTGSSLQVALNDRSLVGYWSMNEGKGSVVHDASGKGNNGTLEGSPMPTWITGKFGSALQFDGSQNYVQITNSSTLRGMSALTIALWVNASSWTPTYYGLVSKWTSGAGRYFLLGYPEGKNLYFWVSDGTNTQYITASLPTLKQWHLLVATFQGEQSLKIFIDGTLAAQATTNITSINNAANNTPLYVGRYATYFASATIQDVQIYNQAISTNDVATLYSNKTTVSPFPIETVVIAAVVIVIIIAGSAFAFMKRHKKNLNKNI